MLTIKKLPIWTAEIDDVPGSTAGLFKALSDAGANLEFALARRQPDKPGKGILFVSQIKGKKQEEAARRAFFQPRPDVVGVNVEGPDGKGMGFKLTAALGNAQLNMRALSATVVGKRFSILLAFDSEADAGRAIKVLRGVK